jgi:N6-adenosine-specific RNA methylase IME4
MSVEILARGKVIPLTRSNLSHAEASQTGLVIPDGLGISEWADIGDALGRAEQSVMWWVGDWWAYGEQQGYGERSRVLEELRAKGHNPPALQTCMNAGTIAKAFTTYRRREVLSWEHHRTVASLDEREQDWLLERAQANSWPVTVLRDEVRRYKLERLRRPGEQQYQTQTIADLQALVAEGRRFGTIYADPPWPYGNQGTRAATRKHYKAHNDLTVVDICNLPVAALAGDNAHCHLWTTNGFLREAFDVMAAWGFTYKSCFVWVKPDFGIGNYWRVGHEFMLFGIRGRAPFGDNAQQSWLYEAIGEHSVKPEKIRRIIERCSPGEYLEMFARREVPGWTVWGNEIERIKNAETLFSNGSAE